MAYYLNPKDCIADKTFTINGVTVKEYLLTKHNPNKISLPNKMTKPVIGVTIHNTSDLQNIEDDGRQYTAATVNNNMNSVRVHYYVDDLYAWQNLPLEYQSWHAGHTGTSPAHGSETGNNQTISIECIMDGSKGDMNEKAEDNTARLAAYLLNKYGLEIDSLFTHNYWENIRIGRTGSVDHLNTVNDGYKGCPIYIRPHWLEFKAKVQKYMNELSGAAKDIPAEVGTPEKSEIYTVQLGAFKNRENAENLLKKAKSFSIPDAFIKAIDDMYYVQVGAFSVRSNAENMLESIKGIFPDAFIKEIKEL